MTGGEAPLPAQPTDAAAQCEPGNSGVTHHARRNSEAVSLCRRVEISEPRSAVDDHASSIWIDGSGRHGRQVDDKSIVNGGEASDVVPATADGNLEPGVTGHADCGRYVGGRRDSGDCRWLREFMAKAEAESDDPAEQLVAFVRLFEEASDQLVSVQSSCLYVSFIYEKQLLEIMRRQLEHVRHYLTLLFDLHTK